MNIELHIERLIIDGVQVESNRRAELRNAVAAELTRLLAGAGLRAELLTTRAVPSLGGGEIEVTTNTSAAQLGGHIAEAVHGRIGAEKPVMS